MHDVDHSPGMVAIHTNDPVQTRRQTGGNIPIAALWCAGRPA